jgi:DHA1 family bicyclomycin/chloramphenicol resistance-like MFS transporter
VRLPPAHLGVAVMVGLGFALLPLSTDLFLAALPGIRRHFGVGVSEAQLTLSVFVAAFAFSQLVYGPLSDRFGRRPVLLAGVTIYCAATIACMTARSIEWLIAARFLQAVGACAGAVIGRAIVRDAYGAAGSARMLGFITAGTALAPVVGPMIGSVLTAAFGWRANFALLAVVGAALLSAAALRLPESNPHRDPRATNFRHIAANYRTVITTGGFRGYALCVAFSYAAIFSFVSGASFVLIEVLEVPASRFGFLFGGTVVSYIVANVLIGKLVQTAGVDRLLGIGTTVAAIGGIAMLALALAGVQSVPAVLGPMAVVLFGLGFSLPSATAAAVGPFARIAGTASALVGFTQMTGGAVVGFVVGRMHDGTTLPMAAGVAAGCLALFAAFRLARSRARPPSA